MESMWESFVDELSKIAENFSSKPSITKSTNAITKPLFEKGGVKPPPNTATTNPVAKPTNYSVPLSHSDTPTAATGSVLSAGAASSKATPAPATRT